MPLRPNVLLCAVVSMPVDSRSWSAHEGKPHRDTGARLAGAGNLTLGDKAVSPAVRARRGGLQPFMTRRQISMVVAVAWARSPPGEQAAR
ncbi:hypothetical protein CFP59_08658 [Streptomyces malaysiensis subsp. malaysiensis]|nr:hypothetical protein CFP59_08658 [Streptomyces sp. M56]